MLMLDVSKNGKNLDPLTEYNKLLVNKMYQGNSPKKAKQMMKKF